MKLQSARAYGTRCHGATTLLATMMVLAGGDLTALPAQAAATGDSSAVSFHGTLRKPPCHINNDTDINVHFGKIGVHKVDGARYKQQIPYQLVCEDKDPSWQLTMVVKGTATGFDTAALSSDVSGLGIRILENGQPMDINKVMNITYDNPPTLEAVPVKAPGTELTEGEFSSTATLLAEYE